LKKILLVIGAVLFFIIGGYFLYNLLFLSNKTHISKNKSVEQNQKKERKKQDETNASSKYKYANPNSNSNFHRKPVKIKSVFSKEEQEKIKEGTLYKNSDIQENKKIDVSNNEIEMLKERIKKPYYFVLLDWDFGGTNKNVLIISFQVYNLTNKNYDGPVDVTCKTMNAENQVIGGVEDEFYITVGALSKRIYKDQIVGIVSPNGVKKIDCDFVYSKEEKTNNFSDKVRSNNIQTNNQNTRSKQNGSVDNEIINQPPLGLFNN